MIIGKFKGWANKAYPKLKFYRQSEDLYYLSDNNKDIQCEVRDGDTYKFPSIFGDTKFTDDYQIILAALITWGVPKADYKLPVDYDAPPRPYKEPETPKKHKKEKKDGEKIEGSFKDRDGILRLLRERYHNLTTIKIPGGALEVVVGDNPGPVLYDFGLTPGKNFGYKFTPYSHQEDTKKIIEDFICCISQ